MTISLSSVREELGLKALLNSAMYIYYMSIKYISPFQTIYTFHNLIPNYNTTICTAGMDEFGTW